MSKNTVWKRLCGALLLLVSGAVAAQTPVSPAPATLSKADQRLLVEMAQANMAEIDAGKIAQQKAQNQQVKDFAQKMVTDHGNALQQVQQVAQAKGVSLPAVADRKHQRMAQRLNSLSGAEFDRRYMAQNGVNDHRQAHQLLQRVQNRATDPAIKALAAKMQPTVDQHLNSVQQLSASLKGGSTSSGSSGTSGSSGSSSTPATPATPDTPSGAYDGNVEKK